jgi:protein-disulfide isomerase-like protein with CxxC motif
MTDEDRQRQMDFILEQQAQFTVNIQQLREQQGRSDARIDRVAAIVEALALSAQAQSERMDSSDDRVNQLAETVDRYIKARGNGSNGAGGA